VRTSCSAQPRTAATGWSARGAGPAFPGRSRGCAGPRGTPFPTPAGIAPGSSPLSSRRCRMWTPVPTGAAGGGKPADPSQVELIARRDPAIALVGPFHESDRGEGHVVPGRRDALAGDHVEHAPARLG